MDTLITNRLIYFLFVLVFLGLSIYGFVLFVKLSNRGIKALDIFIEEKSNKQASNMFVNDNNNNY